MIRIYSVKLPQGTVDTFLNKKFLMKKSLLKLCLNQQGQKSQNS